MGTFGLKRLILSEISKYFVLAIEKNENNNVELIIFDLKFLNGNSIKSLILKSLMDDMKNTKILKTIKVIEFLFCHIQK